jgi:dipeptidyl aminopeptidase/acylaminoacyl peptidase
MTDGQEHKLTEVSGVGGGFDVTADGDVVHTKEVNDVNEIFVDGERVSDGDVDFRSLTWNEDRQSIVALASEGGDSQADVVEVDPDTGNVSTILEADYFTQGLRLPPADSGVVGLLAGKDGGLDIYSLDLDTGEMSKMASPAQFSVAFDWSPDGDAVVYQEGLQENTSLHISSSGGDERVLADTSGSEQLLRSEGFAASSYWGDRGVLFATNEDGDTLDIAVADPETGEVETHVETEHDKTPLGWRPDGDAFAYVEYLGGDYVLKMWEDGDTKRVTDGGHTTEAQWLPGGVPAHRTSTFDSPFGIYVNGDRVIGPEVEADFVEPETVTFESFDGRGLMGLLYEPEEADGALVDAIGGPGQSVTAEFDARKQSLVTEGIAVLVVAYRGCGSLGREHRTANTGDLGGGDARDLAAGAEYLRDRGHDKVGVYGHSYGGYLGLMAEIRSNAFDACINHAGPTDMLEFMERTRGFSAAGIIRKMGGTPDEIAEEYRSRSPITHVDKIKAPVTVVGGENDRHIPPEGFEPFFEALDGAGVAYERVIYNDGHDLHNPENRSDLVTRIAEFVGEN